MGLKLSRSRVPEVSLYEPILQQNDIKGFYDGLISNRVFKDRFKNVPLLKILSMANEVLFFLRNVKKEGIVNSFREIFAMHALMYISEAEIDAFFELFIEHCHKKREDCWDSFEPGIALIKNLILDKEKLKLLRFYEEIKRNPILHNKFRTISPRCLCKMMDEIFRVLERRIPKGEMEHIWDIHRMMDINVEEYDEFIDLFFEI